MKRVLVSLLVSGLVLSGGVMAAEEKKAAPKVQMQILGVGQTACSVVNQQVGKNQQAAGMTYGSWLHGYLSAMNQVAMMQRAAQLNISATQAWSAMVNHCKANPKDSLVAGANKMRVAILQARQKAAVKKK